MRHATLLMVAGMLLSAAAAPALADSIWARAAGNRAAIHTDDTARQIGDVLTIVIAESSVIDNETNRNLDKKSSRTGSADGTLDLANILWPVGKHIFDFPKLSLNSSATNKFDGKATYDTKRTVEDKITVTVQDVLPNGNLVVLGKRHRRLAGDTQTVQASGIVRPSDVTFANTVQSDLVAEFRITYADGARENRFVKPGWLARLLNILNPV
jgi:flagellar L-ring protein precursor FlgH